METLEPKTKTIKKQIAFRPKGWAYAEAFLQAADKYGISESELARECIEVGFAPVTERLEQKKKETQSILARTQAVIFAVLHPRNREFTCS